MNKHKKIVNRRQTKHRRKINKQKLTIRKRTKILPFKVHKRRCRKHPKPVSVVVIDIPPAPEHTRPRKRRSKNGTNRMYFTQETENAIILYNNTENIETRERIFNDEILYPFQKLVENVLNTFKFSYFETGPLDVQKECLSHLVANMHKFDPTRTSRNDPTKKTRAFAYFSIIAKHYLILLNNTNYKKFLQNVEISDEKDEHTVQLQQCDKYYAQQEISDFIRLIIEFWEKNVDKIFIKQRDLNIANAVVELIRRGENISMFNKKALYLYIREIADCRTQQITKVINRMKPIYNRMKQSYIVDGKLPYEMLDDIGIRRI